jgi:cytochrome c peroxidase
LQEMRVMNRFFRGAGQIFGLIGLSTGLLWPVTAQELPNLFPFANSTGTVETYNVNGTGIPLNGAFFQNLGTNGRSCVSCHRPAQGWSISPSELRVRFDATSGSDPTFRTNDGANCNHGLNTATVQDRHRAYSLLLKHGLIRISMDVPANAEFTVMQVRNPYGCGEMNPVSVYRRTLPSTNLRFSSALMWDGRESSPQTGTNKITYETNPTDLLSDLAHQATDATALHAQSDKLLTPEQQQEIVDFEMQLITAQAYDWRAGELTGHGAKGGPVRLGTETLRHFYVGINDPLGGNSRGEVFTPKIFDLFGRSPASSGEDDDLPLYAREREERRRARASIARGEALFNSKPINIRDVAGLNDDLGWPSIPGTCGTCHDSPNVGNHSLAVPLNIGVADTNSPLDVSHLPVIVLSNNITGETKITTDPGRALVTGLWKDVGKVKGPILRGLASRPPYFHNGSAASLADVLEFYDKRFEIGFTHQEKADLIAFLNTL